MVQVEDARLADDAQLAEMNVFVTGKIEGGMNVVIQLVGPVFIAAELAQKGITRRLHRHRAAECSGIVWAEIKSH
jgi:hypothetical protein